MKKIISVALVVLMLAVVFAGCAKPAAPAAATGDKKIVVGFAQIGAESDWRVGCTESVKKACADAGFELKFVDAQGKQDNQIKALRDFITQGVDYIGFSPVVESGWEQVIKEINDAGIPIIMLDRNTDIADQSVYATWIGSNFIEEGQKAANWLIKYLDDNGRGNDNINIVELQGTVGSSPANDRMKGFADTIASKPNLKVTQSQTGNFETDLGKTVMESFLKKADADGVKIDVVYAHNDGMALGAIQAIKEAGLKPGKDIIIIGVDAVKLAFQAMIDGEMNVTVECSPLLGPQFVQAIKDLEAGKTLPKIIWSNESVYEPATAAEDIKTRVY